MQSMSILSAQKSKTEDNKSTERKAIETNEAKKSKAQADDT